MNLNLSTLAPFGVGTLLLLSSLGSAAIAQTAPPPAATPPPPVTSAPAPTKVSVPSKVAVIDIQAAIVQTKDGQKAAADLKTKFAPKQSELEKKQQDIAALQDQLRKGQNTLSEENKQKLVRDIDLKNTSLKRDTEDANADLEQEQQRIMGDLGGKMISILNKYATDNGLALVLDISSQQTPVLFASNTIDITREIIALYDKTAPNFAVPQQQPKMTPPPAPKPATPKPGTVK
jgi:outer membrane protein